MHVRLGLAALPLQLLVAAAVLRSVLALSESTLSTLGRSTLRWGTGRGERGERREEGRGGEQGEEREEREGMRAEVVSRERRERREKGGGQRW